MKNVTKYDSPTSNTNLRLMGGLNTMNKTTKTNQGTPLNLTSANLSFLTTNAAELLQNFSEVVRKFSPVDLQSYLRAISPSTSTILRNKLIKSAVQNLLIVIKERVIEQSELVAETHKTLESLTLQLSLEIEQGRKDSFTKRRLYRMVQEIREEYIQTKDELSEIGGQLFSMYDLFMTFHDVPDYETLLEVCIDDIVDAYTWFCDNYEIEDEE